jgi:predicted CoA-binding protein
MSAQVVVILGASVKPERYANKAQLLLMKHGYKVIPVHPLQKEIAGVPVVKNLTEITGRVDTVTVYLNPEVSKGVANDLIALRPRRVIFNPGTESPELESLLRNQGILVEEACTLVLLGTGQF